MTDRKKQIQNQSMDTPLSFKQDPLKDQFTVFADGFRQGFEKGAEWADANPDTYSGLACPACGETFTTDQNRMYARDQINELVKLRAQLAIACSGTANAVPAESDPPPPSRI